MSKDAYAMRWVFLSQFNLGNPRHAHFPPTVMFSVTQLNPLRRVQSYSVVQDLNLLHYYITMTLCLPRFSINSEANRYTDNCKWFKDEWQYAHCHQNVSSSGYTKWDKTYAKFNSFHNNKIFLHEEDYCHVKNLSIEWKELTNINSCVLIFNIR